MIKKLSRNFSTYCRTPYLSRLFWLVENRSTPKSNIVVCIKISLVLLMIIFTAGTSLKVHIQSLQMNGSELEVKRAMQLVIGNKNG